MCETHDGKQGVTRDGNAEFHPRLRVSYLRDRRLSRPGSGGASAFSGPFEEADEALEPCRSGERPCAGRKDGQ